MRSMLCGRTSIVLLVSLVALLLSSPAGAETTHWLSAQYGTWLDATKWDNGVPNNGATTYDAIIAATGTGPYEVDASSATINSFTLSSPQATLYIARGDVLQLDGSTPSQVLAGMLRLDGGTLRGGQIDMHGNAITTGAFGPGILDDVCIQDLRIANGTRLSLINGSHLVGTTTVGSGTGWDSASLLFQGDTTLDGGNILFGDTGLGTYDPGAQWHHAVIEASGSLTIAPNITVTGGNGRLRADSGTLTNQGTIIVNQPKTCVDLYNASRVITNLGSIQVSNGGYFGCTGSEFDNEGTMDTQGGSTFSCDAKYVQNKGLIHLGARWIYGTSWNILGGRMEGPGAMYVSQSIFVNADLSPGDGLGVMYWVSDQTTLGPDCRLLLDLGDPSNSDSLKIVKNYSNPTLLLQGEVDVTAWAGFGAGRYVIMTYDGTLTNDGMHVGTMPDGFSATLDYSVPGEVGLLVVPEPATLSLLAAGGIALLRRRGATSRR